MIKTQYGFLLSAILCAFLFIQSKPANSFVKVENSHFMLNGKPYYYVGTNFWYGAILGSKGEGGDRERLLKELDFMKLNGITNLRVLVGAEGPEDHQYRVKPSLQKMPGEYNTELLDGLDFLLAEMGKREMIAILFLNNSWDWSGGFGQYLEWNGYGEAPCVTDKRVSWNEFQAFNGQFNECEPCIAQFHNHVRFIINRTNCYTGNKYVDDKAIMAWEIGNEPRAFGQKFIPAFEKMIQSTAALIKSIDKNHMVTTGTEGEMGCEGSIELFERIHAFPEIDYATLHIWPKNWRWIDDANIPSTIENAIEKTNEYLQKHVVVAQKLKKPLVVEEFGLPRDKHGYSPDESTNCRNAYYENILKKIDENANNSDVLAGCNFWAYGGFGRPSQIWFKLGDDYLGDPPCEEQGINSVYDIDSTIWLVQKYSNKIQGK